MDEFQRRDLFHQAANLLEKGWVAGSYKKVEQGTASYCLVGALGMVAFGNAEPTHDQARQTGYWDADVGDICFAGIPAEVMIEWNDGHAAGAEEVIQRLREMAAGEHLDPQSWWREVQGDD